ncbi:hypothetical protein TNCV_4038391 [Trichonephila clavipes]|nr:hypothetical protein TNCV_4038391 [Trichonephila clavipes]
MVNRADREEIYKSNSRSDDSETRELTNSRFVGSGMFKGMGQLCPDPRPRLRIDPLVKSKFVAKRRNRPISPNKKTPSIEEMSPIVAIVITALDMRKNEFPLMAAFGDVLIRRNCSKWHFDSCPLLDKAGHQFRNMTTGYPNHRAVLIVLRIRYGMKRNTVASADLGSFRGRGAEDIKALLALEDQNLYPDNLVKSSLSMPFWNPPTPGHPPQAPRR